MKTDEVFFFLFAKLAAHFATTTFTNHFNHFLICDFKYVKGKKKSQKNYLLHRNVCIKLADNL